MKVPISVSSKQYGQIVGIVLVLLGVLGLVWAEPLLFGLLNVELIEDIVHLLLGVLLLYVGFANVEAPLARTIVGVVGVLLLLVGILGFIDPSFFGYLPARWTVLDNIVHLVLGLVAVAIAWLLPRGATNVTT